MSALLLVLAQAGTGFDANRALDETARSGDLMIVGSGDGDVGSSAEVLEANISGCIVTLKTAIEATDFTARFVELAKIV